MKNRLRLAFLAMIFPTMLLSFGCQKKTAVTNADSESKQEQGKSTRPLEAAGMVGYDGKRLRNSVDRIIDAREKRNRELEKMADGEPDQ